MKTILILLMIFPILVFSQTKEETLEWLNSKLLEHTEQIMGQYKFEIEKANGQEIIYVTKMTNFGSGPTPSYFYFLPADISAVNLTTAYRTDGKLSIRLDSKSNKILKGDNLTDQLPIYCKASPDDEIKRIQKGIIHLLNLMGNPIQEPKELFKD
tara:strand:+ start:637 stop:1101 length:465 start_codon:yes stop_codon:yes gene_type:complete